MACKEIAASRGGSEVILYEVMHGGNAGSSSARHSRPSALSLAMSPAVSFCQAPPWPLVLSPHPNLLFLLIYSPFSVSFLVFLFHFVLFLT